MSVMPHVFFLCIRIDFVVPSVGHRVVFFMSDQCKIEFILILYVGLEGF